MHKTKTVQENNTLKIVRDVKIKTHKPMAVKRPLLIVQNKMKQTYHQVDLTFPAYLRIITKK